MKLFLLLILIFALNSIGFGQKVIVRDTVKSEILRQTRHINVVVPAFPGRQSDCKMNVVYVLDGDDWCAMILGDNIFYGSGLKEKLKSAVSNAENGYATIFGYYVNDPERFGIMEFNEDGKILSVEEKPKNPKSNYCVTGLYFYDKRVVSLAKDVKPSARGELEITSLNNLYLADESLKGIILGRGFAWLDTGTMDSLIEASEFVQMTEKRQGVKISAPEEIAFRNGWIDKETLMTSALRYGKSPYGQHLKNVAEGKFIY